MYGLSVAKVNTLNVEGKKKRGKTGFFRCVGRHRRCCIAAAGIASAGGSGGAVALAQLASCWRRPPRSPRQRPCPLASCRRPDYKKAFVVLNEPSSAAKA